MLANSPKDKSAPDTNLWSLNDGLRFDSRDEFHLSSNRRKSVVTSHALERSKDLEMIIFIHVRKLISRNR